MLDHLGFRVRDLAASRKFYEAALSPLGLTVHDLGDAAFLIVARDDDVPFIRVGSDQPDFWSLRNETSMSPINLAFRADDREVVEMFHNLGLVNGGSDNGSPRWRGSKEAEVYAASLLDPDGNHVEAVYRG